MAKILCSFHDSASLLVKLKTNNRVSKNCFLKTTTQFTMRHQKQPVRMYRCTLKAVKCKQLQQNNTLKIQQKQLAKHKLQ